MKVSKTLLLFLYVNFSGTLGECPSGPGWLPVGPGESCYLISRDHMTWFAAQEFCWNHGGYLVEIDSADEEQLIEQILHLDIHYWIGLNDLSHTGIMRYVLGNNFTQS